MAQATLVEMQIQDGHRLLERLTQEGVVVAAAAWVRETESGDWYLYLATPLVGEDGATLPAYRRVNALIREMEKDGFGMDPFEIKVIGPHDPIANDIVAHRGNRPPKYLTRFQGHRLGELAVEEAFIYPRSVDPKETVAVQKK